MKRVIALLVLLLALAAVVAATRARRLGFRIDAMEIHPGESAVGTQHLGDDLPFAPPRVAVIENVLGDDAVLEDALDHVHELGGADVVVLLGNVLRLGTDDEARRIVATVRDRGFEVIAVPGPHDVLPRTRETFALWIGPERWWFVRRGIVYAGVPGDGTADADFCRAALTSAPRGSKSVVLSYAALRGVDADTLIASSAKDPAQASAVIRVVGTGPDSGGTFFWASGRVPFTPRSVWRRLALDVMFPLVRTTTGYVAFLAGCALVAAFALRTLLGARRNAVKA